MSRESIVPSVELGLKCRHLLQGQVVRCGSRVNLFEDTSKDASGSEEGKGAGESSVLAGKSRLEALLGDILVISVGRILSLDILLLEELGKAENGGGEAVEGIEGPEDLLPGLNGQGAEREALLALVKSKAVRKSDRDTLVVLKALVVGAHGAVEDGKGEALEGVHGVLHENRIECPAPLVLTSRELREIGSIR